MHCIGDVIVTIVLCVCQLCFYHVQMFLCILLHTNTQSHTVTCKHVNKHACATDTHTHTHTHIHSHTHTHTQTHTHIHSHTHTLAHTNTQHLRSLEIHSSDIAGVDSKNKKEFRFYILRVDGRYIFKVGINKKLGR